MGNQHPPPDKRKTASDVIAPLAGLKIQDERGAHPLLKEVFSVTHVTEACQPPPPHLNTALENLIDQARRLAEIDTANDAAHFAILDALQALAPKRCFGIRVGDPAVTPSPMETITDET